MCTKKKNIFLGLEDFQLELGKKLSPLELFDKKDAQNLLFCLTQRDSNPR